MTITKRTGVIVIANRALEAGHDVDVYLEARRFYAECPCGFRTGLLESHDTALKRAWRHCFDVAGKRRRR